MKNFKSKYDLELIRFAINSVRDCSEIFSLGYSFQEADCLTYFLISQIPTYTRINIIDNVVDMHDLYAIEILFDTESQKKILVDFIHGLSQEANFGGIRKNEYFI